jgi:hypothetical protein
MYALCVAVGRIAGSAMTCSLFTAAVQFGRYRQIMAGDEVLQGGREMCCGGKTWIEPPIKPTTTTSMLIGADCMHLLSHASELQKP